MSGELQVVFIYDTLRCRREEDDPSDAILYFHPPEIPELRRIAICGQLMGITQFLVDMFSKPKIISLENGKFALKELGKQYILALGCSSVTPDWLLEKQADILYQVTKFFHKDIDAILSGVGEDRDLLTGKLSSIMDHYIPISQHHGDLFALTFGILPILNLPKSASHISLSATVVLQTCLLRDGVLGGIVMFQNKVIAVELMQELARKLAFIQPYQLPPADAVHTKFNLPPGVQLLKVYMTGRDLEEIRYHASSFQNPSRFQPRDQNGKDKDSRNMKNNKIDAIREEDPSDSCGSSPSSLVSDEPSLLLDNSGQSQTDRSSRSSGIKDKHCSKVSNSFQGPRRFHSLENLAIHHQNNEEDESDVIRVDLKKFSTSLTDPFFPYLRSDGKNISKFYLDANSYPNPDEDEDETDVKRSCNKTSKLKTENGHQKIEQDSSKSKNEKRNNAVNLKFENSKTRYNKEKENEPPMLATNDQDKDISKLTLELKPKLNSGLSRPTDLALNLNSSSSRQKTRRRWSTFEDMMSPVLETTPPSLLVELEGPGAVREKSASISCGSETGFLNYHNPSSTSTSFKSTLFSSFRKISSPDEIELSEMEKSNRAAMFNNHIDNKLNNKGLPSPEPYTPWAPFKGPSESKKSICTDSEVYEESLLFIYSLGGMRLLLLLEKECSNNRELIQTLRDYGSSSISELEVAVSNVEEQGMSMRPGHHDHYCYLHFESVWRSLAHGGRNHSMDFEMVQHMHQNFHIHPNINELIIRGDDHVVYGYQCVGSEVFYQQSAGPQPGLPMPSDIFGKVPIKAKRRLERDHNILLL